MSVTLDALARESGTFLMVAMDQRESLRAMLREHGHDATDERLAAFKLAVARELGPHASGLLIDDAYGAHVVEEAVRVVPPSCGVLLAVDLLDQEPGAVVEDTALDERDSIPQGVAALKLLVIWRDDGRREERVEMARRFVALAARHGVLSVLEPVVRHDDREWAIVEAARELGAARPSLYKGQVPFGGAAPADEITAVCREVDAVLPCPWVVLSQGVEPDAFPAAVEAACRGGASGMLAGRAVWTATLGADDPTELLRAHSVPRLRELAAIVDEHGRPWREKT